jgi:hypothetical protein
MSLKNPYDSFKNIPPHIKCDMGLYLDFLGFFTHAKKSNGSYAHSSVQEYCRKLINQATPF